MKKQILMIGSIILGLLLMTSIGLALTPPGVGTEDNDSTISIELNTSEDNATIVTCALEGSYSSGPVSPEYQYSCCEGLEGYDTKPGLVGRGLLCYDPSKGTPTCKFAGTFGEGWYYDDGGLLVYEDCSDEEPPKEVLIYQDGKSYGYGDIITITYDKGFDTDCEYARVTSIESGECFDDVCPNVIPYVELNVYAQCKQTLLEDPNACSNNCADYVREIFIEEGQIVKFDEKISLEIVTIDSNSVELRILSEIQTCYIPFCEGEMSFTGRYDENGCPIYICAVQACDRVICDEGYAYPTGEYDENNCPIYACSTKDCPIPPTIDYCKGIIIETYDEDGCITYTCNENATFCPAGCVCEGETITCRLIDPDFEEPINYTTKECPIGCECTDEYIACEAKEVLAEQGCAMGCRLDNTCVIQGTRAEINNTRKFCNINSQWQDQISTGYCNNNYECSSNLCIDNECVSVGLWRKFLNWLENLFS